MRLLITVLVLLSVISCDKSAEDKLIENVAPKNIDEYPWAKEQLVEAVKICGEGVVEGSDKPNSCSFKIKVDDLFLLNPVNKTGYKQLGKLTGEGIQWVQPTQKDKDLVPEKWDLRSEYPETKNVPVNRQACGDCWSQSTTKALELMIAAHDKKIVPLSVQTQISTCRPDYGDCGGGYMTAADFLVKIGNPLESQDPYKGTNSSCKFSTEQLSNGFEYKLKSAPWVGNSLMHSKGNNYRAVNSAKDIYAMMFKYKSPALVTVWAYDISGDGIYDSCSAINYDGNHMVDIVGWERVNGKDVAHVWNSWGKGHGNGGISRIQHECGDGRLNRGLGLEARVYEYVPSCPNQPEAITGPDQQFLKLSSTSGVIIGKEAKQGQTCDWNPMTGLKFFDASHCLAFASPEITTEYHLKAKTECGEATSMVLITPLGPKMDKSASIQTPFGIIKDEEK